MSFNYPSHQQQQPLGFDANNHEQRHTGSVSSSSRWIPPKKVVHPPPSPPPHSRSDAAPASKTVFCGTDRHIRDQDRENNYRGRGGDGGGGGGRQGGGKIVRQKRHSSNDTYHQRNLHRRPPPPTSHHQKNIISPTEIASSLPFSSQPLITNSSCSTTTESTNTTTTTNNNKNNQDDAPKLNPTIPAEARRINQRLRQVLFGKNTVGYEEYIKKVPKHKRKHRSLECPMTPDHRADIPTKRWQGLLNAWRRALHQYDPADLLLRQQPSSTSITLAPRPCSTKEDIQAEEIAQAKASGLQVAFGSMNVGEEARLFAMKVAPDDTAVDMAAAVKGNDVNNNEQERRTLDEMSYFDEEAAYQKASMMGETDFLQECGSDSDDDIL